MPSDYALTLNFQQTTTAVMAQQDALLAKVASKGAQYARQRAPVRTGALRASIGYRKVAPGLYEVFVGVPYGVFVELGTSRMAAQPFLGPGLQQAAGEMGGGVGLVLGGG